MFNVNTFQNDMQQRSVPGSVAQFAVEPGKRAILYLFTPTIMPGQMLRPYQYNFNDNLVDQIITAKEKMSCAVAPNGLGISSDLVNTAILPSANGIAINTSALQTQWSFVLITDTAPDPVMRRSALSPTTRVISTGYCSDEPINLATKTPNPAAVLMFTKTNTTYVSPQADQFGIKNKITNASDLDVVSEINGAMANQDLFLATPQDIRSTVFNGCPGPDGHTIGAYGELCLNNVKQGESGKLISGEYKTPKIQLGAIMQALDRSIDYVSALNDGVSSNIGPSMCPNIEDMARQTFDQNVAGSRQSLPRSGLDTSKPISMQNLLYLFPNIDIIPCEVPMASAWDATPQDAITARNSMSSMLSASLSNLVPACGLSNIMFQYSSYATIGPAAVTTSTGVWHINGYGMLVNTTPRAEEQAIVTFKNYFEMELVPILKCVRGDFDLLAYIDMMGYVLIDLVFRDDFLTMKQHEGFYETSNRLGGFLNPMVADIGILNHNAVQLDTLVTDTITKKLSPGMGFHPIIETPNLGVPYGTYPNPTTQMNAQPGVSSFQTKTVQPQTAFDYSSLV